jgi:peroxiredoxin
MSPSETATSRAALAVGEVAPDFSLRDQQGKKVSLSDFRGSKNVVVVFYPFAFSGICTGELCEIRDDLGAFESDAVQVLAISCDHMYTQRAWSDAQCSATTGRTAERRRPTGSSTSAAGSPRVGRS